MYISHYSTIETETVPRYNHECMELEVDPTTVMNECLEADPTMNKPQNLISIFIIY